MIRDNGAPKKYLNIVVWLLILCTLAFIWGNSLLDIPTSKAESAKVVVLMRPMLEPVVGAGKVTNHLVRKLAHIIEFGLLGCELAALTLLRRRRGWKPVESLRQQYAKAHYDLHTLLSHMALYSYEEIDELGEGLIRQYLGTEADKSFCVDIEGFVTEFLGLPLFYRTFAEKDSDKIGFISDGITPLRIYKNRTIVPTVFDKGTIVIEKYLRRENESGRRRFTISHESAHYVMDRTVPQASFHREYDNERSYTPKDLKCLFSFKETQIDRMGAALLMPRFMVFNVAKVHGVQEGLPIYGDSILRAEDKLLIRDMANTMGASFAAFLIRLRELGILKRHDLSEYITGEMGLGRAGDLL